MTKEMTRAEEVRIDEKTEMLLAAEALVHEVEEGNCEYKWKLCDPSPQRFDQLVSQLKWRMEEGMGEAIYEIGFKDDGSPVGLLDEELEKSLLTLEKMAAELKADLSIVRTTMGTEGKCIEALIRRKPESEQRFLDVRVAVIGNVDSGKSTLIGVLTKGQLDNGRGSARLNVFRHRHEAENGRTSDVSLQIVGLDSKGTIVNYSTLRDPSWAEIAEKSSKVLTFIDLAGHEKYIKTTMFGMTAHLPDYAMVMIGGNMGVTKMTKEHLGIALALKIPFYVVITKIDIAPEHILQRTIDTITKILKSPGIRKMPFICKTPQDAVQAAKSLGSSDGRIVPIFLTSCVKGEGLEDLRSFLNLLPTRYTEDGLKTKPFEYFIDDVYSVPGVGTVVAGTVTAGTFDLQKPPEVYLGPDGNGKFIPVHIKSIHNKRMNVRTASFGQNVTFALKKIKKNQVRKGMVVVDRSLATPVRQFDAEVVILHHSTTIQLNYQPMIHCLCSRQVAKIRDMNREVLRTGDRAIVRFCFMYRDEYIKPGARFVFREGKTKGMGKVTAVYSPEEHPNPLTKENDTDQTPVG